MTIAAERVEWLRQAVESGRVHTVRVSFNGRLGDWRGKRIPARRFLEQPHGPFGFCDGMLVCDVAAGIIQETPFSNYETGYPDLHLVPDLVSLREACWAPGEAYVFGDALDAHHRPIDVSPRQVLRRAVERLAARGATVRVRGSLAGRLMRAPDQPVPLATAGSLGPREDLGPVGRAVEGLRESGLPVWAVRAGPDEGRFQVEVGPDEPLALAEALLVTKGALKEVAQREGVRAVFMTLTPGQRWPCTLGLGVEVQGPLPVPSKEAVGARLRELRGLLQPSVTAFKAGPPPDPTVRSEAQGRWSVLDVRASAEADPFTAVAVTLAAGAEEGEPKKPEEPPHDLFTAARALAESTWAAAWLGRPFVENSAPLLAHEGALFSQAVTDWEIERYWRRA